MSDLTERQQEVMDYICEYTVSHGYPPTIRDIGVGLNIASPNGVKGHLLALRRKGRLNWVEGSQRTITVTTLEICGE